METQKYVLKDDEFVLVASKDKNTFKKTKEGFEKAFNDSLSPEDKLKIKSRLSI